MEPSSANPPRPQTKVAPHGKRPPQHPSAGATIRKKTHQPPMKKLPPTPPGSHPPPQAKRPLPRGPVPVGEENLIDTIDESKPILLNWEAKDSTTEASPLHNTVKTAPKTQPHTKQKHAIPRNPPPRRPTPPSPSTLTLTTPQTQQLSQPHTTTKQQSSPRNLNLLPPQPHQQPPQPPQGQFSPMTQQLAQPQAPKKKTGVFGRLFGTKEEDEEEFEFSISAPTNFHQVDGSKDGLKLNEIPDLDSSYSQGQSAKKKRDNANIKPKALLPNEHRVDLEVLKQRMTDMESKAWDLSLVDYWSTRSFPIESWVEDESVANPKGVYSLAAKDEAYAKGYHVEECKGSTTHKVQCDYDCVTCKDVPVLYADKDIPYYELFFADRPHENYYVDSTTQPLIVSIIKVGELCKVLIWSKKENKRVLVYPENYLKTLKSTIPEMKDAKLVKVKNNQVARKELLDFEKLEIRTCFKFGIVYCKEDERDEDNLFGATEWSPGYEDFLGFIGDTIRLLNWDKYRAGLDVKFDNTGKYSVYTTFRTHEIMFHVCTMLPFLEIDTQKVERKRHIGNDVVTIVYKDQSSTDDLFDPCIFTSHFIHCIFIISPAKLGADGLPTHYRLTIANKPGVPPYPPELPDDPVFEKGENFRQFLLVKMINAERAAYSSPEFSSLTTSRKERLLYICNKLKEENK